MSDRDALEMLACVQRMRSMQQQRDAMAGCSLAYRELVRQAEADVDTMLLRLYLPELEPTPLEGGVS